MNCKFLPLLLLVAAALFCSCGDDEPTLKLSNIDLPHSLRGAKALPYSQRMEVPAIKNGDMFVVHYTDFNGVTYTLEWDQQQKTQRWSAYTMNKNNNTKGWTRNSWEGAEWKGTMWYGDPFQEDSILPRDVRTTLADHEANGYDRGHIVNSNDRLISMNANGQTYYLSNIQPQRHSFNAGVWLNFENVVHNWGTSLRYDETLYIVKGGTTQVTASVPQPFIDDSRARIKVPRYFFMAILKYDSTKGSYQAIGLWAEHKANDDTKVRNYAISIDELEKRTGIDFYPNLKDDIEDKVERVCNTSDWSWGKYY